MIAGASITHKIVDTNKIESIEDFVEQKYLEGIHKIKKLGFKQVEVSVGPLIMILRKKEIEKFIKNLVSIKKQLDIVVSVHLPFRNINIASLNEEVRQASVKIIKKSIFFTSLLEPRYYVLHVFKNSLKYIDKINVSGNVKTEVEKRIYEAGNRSLADILEIIEESRKICVENLVESKLEWNEKLVNNYDLSLCFDMGHKYLVDQEVIHFFKKNKKRIFAIHAHNVQKTQNPEKDYNAHHTINEGYLDYNKVLSTLKKQNYQGSFVIEVKTYKDVVSSARLLNKYGLLDN